MRSGAFCPRISPAGSPPLPDAAPARAELIADRGASAQADEFFRSAEFHAAEGVTHSLLLHAGDAVAAMGVIVREVPGAKGQVDAVSAYGYPGGNVPAGWTPPSQVDWSPTGLVSLFARERLDGCEYVGGAVERGRVLVHDPAEPRDVRPRLAEQIRAAERLGYEVELVPGGRSSESDRKGFHRAYTQTMQVTGATERYFFDRAYFDAVLAFPDSWLVVARSQGLPLAAGAIVARSDGHLHYFLGGTADEARPDSPFKNVVAAMLDLADEVGLPLNLGGGLEPGDGLERFKRGFANGDAPFRAHAVVCDVEAYERLGGGHPPRGGGFFPAYRA
jgi:GNAT acetyltransferase-like protein